VQALETLIGRRLDESMAAATGFVRDQTPAIIAAAERLAACFASGHKLLLFGNGGSAADAQHIAAEFANRFDVERPPLAALALTTDTSVLTSIANDEAFEAIFAKQIQALGQPGDIALGISTSGRSANVARGLAQAKVQGLYTMALLGAGGPIAAAADLPLCVPSSATPRIQEVHSLCGHLLCELVERILYPAGEG
jgi:D-sedoheptulose 7-phosphate isomerase